MHTFYFAGLCFFPDALFLALKQQLAPDKGRVSGRRVRLEEGMIKRDQQQHFACFNRTLCFARLLPGLGTTTSMAKQKWKTQKNPKDHCVWFIPVNALSGYDLKE